MSAVAEQEPGLPEQEQEGSGMGQDATQIVLHVLPIEEVVDDIDGTAAFLVSQAVVKAISEEEHGQEEIWPDVEELWPAVEDFWPEIEDIWPALEDVWPEVEEEGDHQVAIEDEGYYNNEEDEDDEEDDEDDDDDDYDEYDEDDDDDDDDEEDYEYEEEEDNEGEDQDEIQGKDIILHACEFP